MNYYQKLYALLHDAENPETCLSLCSQLNCFEGQLGQINTSDLSLPRAIADSSDRVNLPSNTINSDTCEVRHPISGQPQTGINSKLPAIVIHELGAIANESDVEKVFWWFWRFYPDILAQKQTDALLVPAHKILPDCPIHSYKATVSALTGAMFPDGESAEKEHPYLLLFTFSPVQEFIKASRKFLDFWAGSYLLHYLGAKVCWYIAEKYGPDAVITPSLWGQEIIDALILEKYPSFEAEFQKLQLGTTPVTRFEVQDRQSTSLSTAGFPNTITVLVSGKAAAEQLGKELELWLKKEWQEIAHKVRKDIKTKAIAWLKVGENRNKIAQLDFYTPADDRDLEKWQQPGCWEWNYLWEAQINNSWEAYWTAVPLGDSGLSLMIEEEENGEFNKDWKQAQEAIAPSRSSQSTPTPPEETFYNTLNVGTWWGNVQSRLGRLIQSIKNTRTWQIPAAPGERSTLSGQYSAVHPNLLYRDDFCEGGGVSAGSMRLFWEVMAKVYPGVFNGSEKLNAIELTKRMAWGYGGVAESLGITINRDESAGGDRIDYESLIRFPNLSSIATARFAFDNLPKVQKYWNNLNKLMRQEMPEQQEQFAGRTRGRPFHVYKTDRKINPQNLARQNYNGVMFSSKWLAEDMSLEGEQLETLRKLVDRAHKDSGFGDGSPADWWAIVLADGDSMGKYVSGGKLKDYREYIVQQESEQYDNLDELLNTKKRMGPATHVGLNRALLDFSNRLVPHITEKRFCGKVVYSGGDDVMAVLPLADLPEYLLSLRAAWCGSQDPGKEFNHAAENGDSTGYWQPKYLIEGLPNRPLFTMGEGATMSAGIVIAHKSVPLPTVLESLWTAEKERAKKLPGKDGLCFRVIYGGGNTLEAVMKGNLLESWYGFLNSPTEELSPLLYRLAEELPQRACVTESNQLFEKAARVIINRRDESKTLDEDVEKFLVQWLNDWEEWVKSLKPKKPDSQKHDLSLEDWLRTSEAQKTLGIQPQDLGKLLRFTAFWVDKMVQQAKWVSKEND
ncbi:MAG: type III-B CRISPR-associated protein Cas10/Cmr2 [Microcoleus sp. PH2017_40_RAT_O_B]|uniref:type III-B CRISPR-associated protein Cas10/Cmr2 n=1 Tax=unclassified Microcoleus TaxID=2642155 RepID=UPI001DCE113C|nr:MULTISPECIES: type III-B CRISPR-associated protein Cas10/Cmr2 [unclassified Microcoleus]MCC3575783.1 type III-B CRISPR-associated protein Cas10/Cmr2 [Microcoleus sp. PH2017_34_RAT_O_A]MCC3613495.1 type III-B CRISPR-associated protein Cas10/Cmr2 [Microcoleus sp. PH2017_40_RAT_O_B]